MVTNTEYALLSDPLLNLLTCNLVDTYHLPIVDFD